MKRIVSLLALVALLLAIIPSKTYAVSAYPGVVQFKQPDGKVVNVVMKGDEYLNWAETEDGYTLMYDSIGGLVYAEHDATGNLRATKVRASNLIERTSDEQQITKRVMKHLPFSGRQLDVVRQVRELRAKEMVKTAVSGEKKPVVGTRKMLVILVEFPDCKFQHTVGDFEMLMNQLNYTEDGRQGSVRDYYKENSFGKLDLVTDVVGVYRLSRNYSYYGGATVSSSDANPRAMAMEAVTMANGDVNFADYDADTDGVVDGVHIIYAGPGEEAGGGSNRIWAHSWTVSAKFDGVRLNKYSCSPEIRGAGGSKMTHIGVICHEIGHVLGCMDFYDTNYNTGGQYPGTGTWDLMASGNWNGDGACPAHFNPFVKIYDYGWAEAKNGNIADSFTLQAKSENGFVRIDTKTDNEYFLLEYRAKSGFDSFVPGHGLMVYRASGGMSRMSTNTLNASHQQQFYPLCANAQDGIPTSAVGTYGSVNVPSAPFPGTSYVDALTDNTAPSMRSWNGLETGFPITSITEDVNNETISFDVSGGKDGGVYSFKVTDTDTVSISLAWEKQDSQKVLLVYNENYEFGAPTTSDYNIGDVIDGGGKVIYVGTGSEFKHSDLAAQTDYFYKIYTLRNNGTWNGGRELKANTQVGIIRKFPFEDNFESGILADSYRQEHVVAQSDWSVGRLLNTSEQMLLFLLDNDGKTPHTQRQKTRLILPIIDFTDVKCATLSFDYRNFVHTLEVYYRISPNDDWHFLQKYDSKHNGMATGLADVTNGDSHVDIELSQLSSTYEIAFVVDYRQRGSSWSNIELATLDNIKISADYKAFVATPKPTYITNSSVEIKTVVFSGTEQVTEKGVKWSTDQKTWKTEKANVDDVVELMSLTSGSTIYYQGYATLASGEVITGDVKTFTTMSFTSGKGSEDDPFIINNDSDWNKLRTLVNGGNDCEGLYFALGKSFSLSNKNKIKSVFNGSIDGRGYTISLGTGNFNALFEVIGGESEIKNLNMQANSITLTEHRNSMIAIYNVGTISNCNIKINAIVCGTSGNNFGGVCSDNQGYIFNCHSQITASGERIWAGGICWYNKGFISACSFSGKLTGNNNSKIGGIASINYDGLRHGKDLPGIIVDCVNNGEIGYYLNSENSAYTNSFAGIAGSNYGTIKRCVNKGKISILDDYSNGAAGITCGDEGTIMDCYNIGDIIVTKSSSSNHNTGIGGIAARMRSGNIANCFSFTGITVGNSSIPNVAEVLSYNEASLISNCYYAGSGKDEFAEKRSLSEFASEEMVYLLNENGANDVWVVGEQHPVLKWEDTNIVISIDYIAELSADKIIVPWLTIGDDISLCGIEWRESGTGNWSAIGGDSNCMNHTEITGLTPKTSYEVRVFVYKNDGSVMYSPIEKCATTFSSTGTKEDPHMIEDYAELLAFSSMLSCGETFQGELVCLQNDINLKGKEGVRWEPMQSRYSAVGFQGEFDGGAHVISNMYINTTSGYAGFFGIANGYIHDLTIMDSEIICNAYCKHGNPLGGTGGIVGDGSLNSLYPYVVERCGFKGVIRGGLHIGGIIGRGEANAVNNCYANASITYLNSVSSWTHVSGVGGIVGGGNASNSYFVGDISLESSTFGVGWGPIAGRYPVNTTDKINTGCYYNATCNKPFTNVAHDTQKDIADMMTDSFLSELPVEIWARVDSVNDGLPFFSAIGNSRVTTDFAEHNTIGDVAIYSIYTHGVNKDYAVRGVQWRTNANEKAQLNCVVTSDTTSTYKVILPNKMVNSVISYRAFASQGTDSIFGEWKEFVPEITNPELYVLSVTGEGNGKSTLAYSIYAGSRDIVKVTLSYFKEDNPDEVIMIEIGSETNIIELENIENDVWYICKLICETQEGLIFESDETRWSTKGMSGIDEVAGGVLNADVYTLQGVLVKKNVPMNKLNEELPSGVYLVNDRVLVIK